MRISSEISIPTSKTIGSPGLLASAGFSLCHYLYVFGFLLSQRIEERLVSFEDL
jgi:hypothetical protein